MATTDVSRIRRVKPRAATLRRPPVLSHQEIALRAYQIFLSRGAAHGRDVEDWLEAEDQLLAERPG